METQNKTNVRRTNHEKDRYLVGYLGECYVALELAKRKIYAHRMDYSFEFDLYLVNGLRVEVKTSNINNHHDKRRGENYVRKIWAFNNPKKNGSRKPVEGKYRHCDYYVFVCFDKLIPVRYYIVPNKIISNRRAIHIPVTRKVKGSMDLEEYRDKWNLLTIKQKSPPIVRNKKKINKEEKQKSA